MVGALALSGDGFLYVGGSFNQIGSQARYNIAKISTTDYGLADAGWAPSMSSSVTSLALHADSVYAIGSFDAVNGVARPGIAKLATSNGALDASWNPAINGMLNQISVQALVVDVSGMVHMGGRFTEVDGQTRMSLAVLTDDGTLEARINDVEAPGWVGTLARQSDGDMIAGGGFLRANGQPRGNLLRLHADGSLDMDWNPNANGNVRTVAAGAGDVVYAGGDFTWIGGLPRSRIAKITGNEGAVDTGWNPYAYHASNPLVYVSALAVDTDDAVYVAGLFTQIGGQLRNRFAKLSPSGLADTGWDPGANGHVQTLVLDGNGMVYVGGSFSQIGTESRSYLARLSTADGTVDLGWNPVLNNQARALALDTSGAVYVGGYFTEADGQPHKYLARLSGDDGAVDSNWKASLHDNDAWNSWALALHDSGAVYVGGSFREVNGQPRNRIARLSGIDGALDSNWNPSPNQAYVYTLMPGVDGVMYAGGDFTEISGQFRGGIAALPSPAVSLTMKVEPLPVGGRGGSATRSYQITVANIGIESAEGVQVHVPAPVGLSAVQWSVDEPNGATPPNGSNAVATSFDLPPGTVARIVLTGTLDENVAFVDVNARASAASGTVIVTAARSLSDPVNGIGLMKDSFE